MEGKIFKWLTFSAVMGFFTVAISKLNVPSSSCTVHQYMIHVSTMHMHIKTRTTYLLKELTRSMA